MYTYDNTPAINRISWSNAPASDSGLRAFARRHNFYPHRTISGKWAICWSSTSEVEQYDYAIEAIRAEVAYRGQAR